LEKQICENCGRECIKHAKGMCTTCYKKIAWKPKLQKCIRCGRMLKHQAKGYCPGCYNYVFHLESTKAGQRRKLHNIDNDTYKKITQRCLICGFDKVVDLHHLDESHDNNSIENMVGLCPNHHKMLHDFRYKEEVLSQIRKALLDKKSPLSFEEECLNTVQTTLEIEQTPLEAVETEALASQPLMIMINQRNFS